MSWRDHTKWSWRVLEVDFGWTSSKKGRYLPREATGNTLKKGSNGKDGKRSSSFLVGYISSFPGAFSIFGDCERGEFLATKTDYLKWMDSAISSREGLEFSWANLSSFFEKIKAVSEVD